MGTLLDLASLVMIPSGVKEDKLYSVKPTDGSGDFTFSRNSDIQATRVNSSGLIEKAKVNNLLQSNTFSNASWGKTGTPVLTSGQSDPFGGTNAWKFESSSAVSTQIFQSATFNTGSIYAKAGNVSSLSIWANLNVTFDLSTGTITSGAANGTITDVGGGWYRCSVFNPTANVFNPNFTATASGEFVYIAFSQANYGLIAQDYVETTTTAVVEGLTADLPRLDYSGGASCPSLLLEPSRTNYATQSEYIGAWAQSDTTGTDNFAVSPEGVQNASKLSASLTSATHFIQLTGGAVGNTATISLFAKADTGSYIQLTNPYSGAIFANFDVATGVVGTKGPSCISSDIEDYGNGWYRCIAVFDNTGFNSNIYRHYIVPSASATFGQSWLPASDTSLFIYGHSWEAGSYPTSYIPTYGASAQRNADACSKTGISSLIGQTEGTIYWEVSNISQFTGNGARFFSYTDSNNFILINPYGTVLRVLIVSSGTAFDNFLTISGDSLKIAIAYKANDYKFYVNGVSLGSPTATSVPAMSAVGILDDITPSGATSQSETSQLLLFKTRLSNTELAALTTL